MGEDSSKFYKKNDGYPRGPYSSWKREDPALVKDPERAPSMAPVVTIDIAPGVSLPLRGSQETLQALSKGFVAVQGCFVCTTCLVCIADAAYVLCPECKTISPANSRYPDPQGVGLGLNARDYPM